MTIPSTSSSPAAAAGHVPEPQPFSYKHATYEEVVEDLSSRFIMNLPPEELESPERICFQVEQAHWYYEDFIREENSRLPSYNLKQFSALLFQSCPILQHLSNDLERTFNSFMRYKTRVPVCGAIMLDDTWEECVLVRGFKQSAGWSFPKGKINENESREKCAIREVLEETGYNLAGQVRSEDVLELTIKEQTISLFVVPNVPKDFRFETRTRKEIGAIEWHRLSDLPTWKRGKNHPKTQSGKYYLIAPFIGLLQRFIHDRKPRPPRKQTKQKRQTASSSENKPARRDVVQESSSQSSSTNGDPLTPSPHQLESVPHRAPAVVDDDLSKLSTVDPHFARLLSGLSAPVPKNTQEMKETSVTLLDTQKASVDLTKEESLSPLVLPSDPIRDNATSPRTNLTVTLEKSTMKDAMPGRLSASSRGSQSLVSPSSMTTSSVTSSKVSGRRGSSTADISPYLARSAEIPTSGKRMRELALLETVADESARMSSYLSNREEQVPLVGFPPNHVPFPPPPLLHEPPVIYSSQPPHPGLVGPQVFGGPPRPMTAMNDPYARPNTSHAFHRMPSFTPGPSFGPGSMSMNQSQLLAIINDASSRNHPLPHPHDTPHALRPPLCPPGLYPVAPSVSPLSLYASGPSIHPLPPPPPPPGDVGMGHQPLSHPLPPPARMPVPPPFTGPKSPTMRPESQSLLSILNSAPQPQ